ncbi:hypothetical protein ACI5FR_16340 [Paenibacillus sp. HJGM_3]
MQKLDRLSGVASSSITVDGNPYTEGAWLDWAGKLGPHWIHVTVTDIAGNKTEVQFNLVVETSIQSVIQLVKRYAAEGQIHNPALQQLLISQC